MPFAGGTSRWRVLYCDSDMIASSMREASQGSRALGQCTPSWNQNMESSYA